MEENETRPEDPTVERKLPPKALFLAPNRKEYYLSPTGQIKRVDLKDTTRREWREKKKQNRRKRIRELKLFSAQLRARKNATRRSVAAGQENCGSVIS